MTSQTSSTAKTNSIAAKTSSFDDSFVPGVGRGSTSITSGLS